MKSSRLFEVVAGGENIEEKTVSALLLTSGCGLPWPEHSMCPPVLLENSILCGGSCENTGPCRSNAAISGERQRTKKIGY